MTIFLEREKKKRKSQKSLSEKKTFHFLGSSFAFGTFFLLLLRTVAQGVFFALLRLTLTEKIGFYCWEKERENQKALYRGRHFFSLSKKHFLCCWKGKTCFFSWGMSQERDAFEKKPIWKATNHCTKKEGEFLKVAFMQPCEGVFIEKHWHNLSIESIGSNALGFNTIVLVCGKISLRERARERERARRKRPFSAGAKKMN